MKHAANRHQPTAKPKAKTLTQAKTVTKIKPPAKKPVGKIALNVRATKMVLKAKAAVKTKPSRTKPATKTVVPKLSAKTLNALKTISARRPVAKLIEQPNAKKSAARVPVKLVKPAAKEAPVKNKKPNAAKAKAIVPAKKPAAKNVSKFETTTKTKLKTATAKLKPAVKKTSVKAAKTATGKAKARLPKVEKTVAKRQPVLQKSKPVRTARKPKKVEKKKLVAAPKKLREKKSAPPIAAKTSQRKLNKVQIAAPKKVVKKANRVETIIKPKKISEKPQTIKLSVAPKKTVQRTLKLKPAISAAMFGKRVPKAKKKIAVEKIKPIEIVVEEAKPQLAKPKNRKAKQIGSAVFRGKKERYDFKVFELNEIFEPIPAVYIISKRKTDRNKRGHHALICIGATDSISAELKRHRKGKCVKKHQANVVSILPEANEKIRLRIETDLKAAHNVVCNFE